MVTKFSGGVKVNEQKRLFSEAGKEVDLVCQNLTLGEANALACKIISLSDAHCSKIQVVGSMRRLRAVVKDVDFLVISSDEEWRKIGKELELMLSAKLTMKGDKIKRFLVPFARGQVQADFYRATEKTWGIYELIRTGSADHNIYLAKYALKNDMQLKYSVGLVNLETEQVIASKTEEEVFKGLGLDYVNPVLREMYGSVPLWKKKQ